MMLNIEQSSVRRHLLKGNFGLEKENLRVLENGTFSHTPHPFPDDAHIAKDFCENQIEINTSVHTGARGAIEELKSHEKRLSKRLLGFPEKEYLWPFSNPPYIKNEEDIPIAVFEGIHVSKTAYRDYLSKKYGRYKMAFSGVHVNYSFAEELLRADYEAKQNADFSEKIQTYRDYKDRFYLDLAEKMAAYGWILTAASAASPLLDSSFMEQGVYGGDIFTGMASVRCSEMGYWNEFAPILDYAAIGAYTDSIQKYVKNGFLKAPSELYYPIRIKPAGENSLQALKKCGADHIELRMFDLNPLAEAGVEEKDILFAQLLMAYLASVKERPLAQKDQIQAVQNFKNAARYDLKTVRIWLADGENRSVSEAAMTVIDRMKAFYRSMDLPVQDILDFEREKFMDAKNRYAWQIREKFQGGYVRKALILLKEA